ncbi:hypothetical protein HMPREF3291_22610 [Bacillus sp. HMSC76G11]|nr:hypothetical protein HMPREF3291_22610 [Bacillus sp. HMSC76G11]
MKFILILLTFAAQTAALIFLCFNMKLAVILFLIHLLSMCLLFSLLIKARLKEKKEDDERDYRNY